MEKPISLHGIRMSYFLLQYSSFAVRLVLSMLCAVVILAAFTSKALAGDLDEKLLKAAETGNVEEVRALLEKGASVNAKSDDGKTALMWAAAKGSLEVVKALIEKRVDINAKTTNMWPKWLNGWSALMFAANHGNCKVVRILLANGADVNVKADDNSTVLMQAIGCHEDIMQAAKATNKTQNAISSGGQTALQEKPVPSLVWASRQVSGEIVLRGIVGLYFESCQDTPCIDISKGSYDIEFELGQFDSLYGNPMSPMFRKPLFWTPQLDINLGVVYGSPVPLSRDAMKTLACERAKPILSALNGENAQGIKVTAVGKISSDGILIQSREFKMPLSQGSLFDKQGFELVYVTNIVVSYEDDRWRCRLGNQGSGLPRGFHGPASFFARFSPNN